MSIQVIPFPVKGKFKEDVRYVDQRVDVKGSDNSG